MKRIFRIVVNNDDPQGFDRIPDITLDIGLNYHFFEKAEIQKREGQPEVVYIAGRIDNRIIYSDEVQEGSQGFYIKKSGSRSVDIQDIERYNPVDSK